MDIFAYVHCVYASEFVYVMKTKSLSQIQTLLVWIVSLPHAFNV